MKLNTRSLLRQTFWLYLPSLAILLALLYFIQTIDTKRFKNITTVDYTQCDSFTEQKYAKFKRRCLDDEKRKENALQSNAYKALSNTGMINKSFALITKDDHKNFDRLHWLFIIETMDKSARGYQSTKKQLLGLQPAINEKIDEVWSMLYILINPIIPFIFVILLTYLKQLFSPLIKKLKTYPNK